MYGPVTLDARWSWNVPSQSKTTLLPSRLMKIEFGAAGGALGCTRMERFAGIYDWPPSMLNSRKTSKKLLMR